MSFLTQNVKFKPTNQASKQLILINVICFYIPNVNLHIQILFVNKY